MNDVIEFLKTKWNQLVYFLKYPFFNINILSIEDTLNTVIRQKKSLSRLGDGEFNLVFLSSLVFQKANADLSERLKGVMQDRDRNENCLVCIPGSYSSLKSLTNSSKHFWSYYWNCNKSKIFPLLNHKYCYGDAQCTRIFVNRKDKMESKNYFELWKKIWEGQDILLVEGEFSRFGVGNDLFAGANSISRIICPAENAFDAYGKIRDAILEHGKDKLVLLVLGPTATVLSYELSQNNLWVVDSGNLDMEYEWSKINTDRQTSVKGKYTLEAENGTVIDEVCDDIYINQILLRIH